jgi:hypothetical protein
VTCAGHVRKVHNAGGIPDLIVDGGHAARLLREQESNVERPAGLACATRAPASRSHLEFPLEADK